MTNEELAALIRAGQTEYIAQLWKQVVKFIDTRAGKFLDGWPDHYRYLQGDMVNESYFHFLKAIDGYNQEKGSFTTYLSWHIRNAFIDVLQGRGERLKNEPLNQAVSLDVPLSDTDDLTLAETLIDETSEAAVRRIEDMDFWESVGKFLEDSIDRIRDRIGAEIIRYMYHNDCTVKAASIALYGAVPVPYEHYRKAMRQIRAYMKRRAVRSQMAMDGLDDYLYYYGNGLDAYKHRIFTSKVEQIAIQRADVALKLSDMQRIFIQ